MLVTKNVLLDFKKSKVDLQDLCLLSCMAFTYFSVYRCVMLQSIKCWVESIQMLLGEMEDQFH